MLDKHNQELRLAAKDIAKSAREVEQTEVAMTPEEGSNRMEKSNSLCQQIVEKRLSKYELNFLEVKRLRALDHSIRSIHRQTGVNRQTIKRCLNYQEYPQKVIAASKASKALPFEDYLRKKWTEGETRHMQLWREIKEQEFTGLQQSVYRFVCKYPKDCSSENLPSPLKVKTWSARKVSLLMSKPFEDLDEASHDYLRTFLQTVSTSQRGQPVGTQI